MNLGDVEKLLSVNDVAALFEIEPRVVRRCARKGLIPGQYKILGKLGFDPDKLADWTPPEVGVFGARTPKRDDGRQRYHIFLTAEEEAKLSPHYELVDPRVAAKARRAARKAAKAEAGEGQKAGAPPSVAEAEDPFADFGL